jgi:ABC-type antimicrobial peptide transport system permease subunit
LVLGGALRLVAIGVALGLPIAWWTSRLVSGMLYGLTATDPLTIAAAVAVLGAAALAAGFIPAHRASRVEPMAALRYE